MGKLLKPPPFYGTIHGVCIYRMHGEDFIRAASSLVGNGKRVKREAAFKNTMASANRLALASRLASAVYAMLPVSRRKFPLYRKLTGQAAKLLKAGTAIGMVVAELMTAIRLKPRVRKQRAERKKRSEREQPGKLVLLYARQPVSSFADYCTVYCHPARLRHDYS